MDLGTYSVSEVFLNSTVGELHGRSRLQPQLENDAEQAMSCERLTRKNPREGGRHDSIFDQGRKLRRLCQLRTAVLRDPTDVHKCKVCQ
jgi:hypothetical protein